MRKSTNSLAPAQVYRYAVQVIQPYLKFRDTANVTGSMVLTVLFAAAARISSLSDTCQRLRGVPDEHAVASALYSSLPAYNALKRQVNAALAGHLPKALRRRPQTVALDLTLLPYYGADARTNREIYRSKAKRGTSSFYAYATAYIVHNGQRYTVALTAVTRGQALAEVARELLVQVRKTGIHVKLVVVDREFYSVEVIRYFQAARCPFLMPVVGHGRKADHPLGPSGSQVFKQWKRSGWAQYTLADAKKRKATVWICVKCRNRRGERGQRGREALVYAYWGIRPKRYDWVRAVYRSRFGIETSYRQMNQCRIRTTSRRFEVRFLYVAIAFLLRNLWVWLHHAVLSSPRQGGPRFNLHRLRLKTMLLWLLEVAVEMYGFMNSASSERPLPQGLTE
jgi:Transposase DDE domain